MRISACHCTRAARQLGAFSRLGVSCSTITRSKPGSFLQALVGRLGAAIAGGRLSASGNLLNTRA